ncbi:YceI family protein [Marinoscillum pacificum]|uniref:YceI family protein n=1 Tax=Marinoscillum pacificum TaxID=392723 RepID=UPI0021573C61|nr:YceI family protein [Marinoscillum pacificum]
MKQTILTSFFTLVSLLAFSQSTKRNHEVTVTSSKFTIEGSTNVNQFKCSLEEYLPSDTLAIKSTWNNKRISFENLILTYPVSSFDCGIAAMNQDMQSLLKSEDYPTMILHIEDIDLKNKQEAIETLYVSSKVKLTIANVTREVSIKDGIVTNHSESSLTFSGTVDINMKDFQMEPPVKFWGMVQVNEKLTVRFAVRMEVKNL